MTAAQFEVDTDTEVFDRDGTTVVGVIRAGTRYEAETVDEHWLRMRAPDGSPGYVRADHVRLSMREPLSTPAVATPPPSSSAAPEAGGVAPSPSVHGPPEGAPTGTRRRRWILVLAAALVAGAVAFVVLRTPESDGDASATRTVVLDRALARDLDDDVAPELDRRVDAQELPASRLVCDLGVASPDAAVYEGTFDVGDVFGGTENATVTCNVLRLEVIGNDVAALSGHFVVEGFPSEVNVSDQNRVVGTRCRSDVANSFELSAVLVAAERVEVGIDVFQTLGIPTTPEPACNPELGREYRVSWEASVVWDEFTAILDFTDSSGVEVSSMILGRVDP